MGGINIGGTTELILPNYLLIAQKYLHTISQHIVRTFDGVAAQNVYLVHYMSFIMWQTIRTTVLTLPAHSQDLNAFEHLWEMLQDIITSIMDKVRITFYVCAGDYAIRIPYIVLNYFIQHSI